MATNSRKVATDVEREKQNTKIWLEALEGEQDRLSQWEQDFVANMSDWFAERRLSQGQYEKLEQIYLKYF